MELIVGGQPIKSFDFGSEGVTKIRGRIIAASLLSGLLSSFAAWAEPARPMPAPTATTEPSAKEAAERENWRKKMLRTPRPTSGCFAATFPETEWREVPCKTPPHKLYPPRHGQGIRVDTVGGSGPDFSAVVTGNVSEAVGSFDPGTVVSSECAVPCPIQNGINVCPTNPTCTGAPANTYSLQLNTQYFKTNTCAGSPGGVNGGCMGWQQFVYDAQEGGVIQYWLLNFGPAGTNCPTPRGAHCLPGRVSTDGWCPFSFTPGGKVFCVVNSSQTASVPSEPITKLSELKITAAVAGVNGKNDSIVVTAPDPPPQTMYPASGNNYFPDLGSQWQEAEFNVFGDGNGDQAVFNSGATVVVRTTVDSGTTSMPGCDERGFTGESNNLTLVNCCPIGGASPAILFTESNAAGAIAMCPGYQPSYLFDLLFD